MLIIPVLDTSSQIIHAALGGQSCTISLYQKTTGLFCDISVSDSLILGGVICLDATTLLRDRYLGFIGDLAFYDTQGTVDPSSPGLGSRFLLAYLEVSDLE